MIQGLTNMATAPLVLIHGLIGTLEIPDLVGHFPDGAMAPDLLGYGSASDVAISDINLHNQALHLHELVSSAFGGDAVDVVGHSVGGAVAALFARMFPDRLANFVSVEGNFTPKDAFWSASVARMPEAETDRMLAGFRQDPASWLAADGIPATPRYLEVARHWLHYQPASTVRAMAQSVVQVTGEPCYLRDLRVFVRHPVHLVAGARSFAAWDVPDWALDASASLNVQPGGGHMMMLEDPRGFVSILKRVLGTAA